MKSDKFFKIILCIFISVFAVMCCSAGVFALDDDVIPDDLEFVETEPQTQEPDASESSVEPETEPSAETEPYTEPETEASVEETATAPQTEPETESAATQEPATENSEEETDAWLGLIDDATVNPTQLSTSMVSMKPYETNYAAGIVSWVCVIVGVIVIAAVLISTKRGTGKKLCADEEYYSARR